MAALGEATSRCLLVGVSSALDVRSSSCAQGCSSVSMVSVGESASSRSWGSSCLKEYFWHSSLQAPSSLTSSLHLWETCEARARVVGSSTHSRIYKRVRCGALAQAAARNKGTRVHTRKDSSVGSTRNGSFFSLGLTNSATKLSSWLSHRFSSSPSSRSRSARFMSPKCPRMALMWESSCSDAVLQSGALCVGVGLGAGVGGEAGAEGSRLCGIVADSGLVGVMMGRGTLERDSRLGLRVCATGDESMAARDDDAEAEAAISVSESSWTAAPCWPSRWGGK